MARIVGHLPVGELEARYRAAQDATEARHLQAIWLLAQGRTVLEVSEILSFVPRWVTQLAARYNASGPAALGDLRRRKAATLGPLHSPPSSGGSFNRLAKAASTASVSRVAARPFRRRRSPRAAGPEAL